MLAKYVLFVQNYEGKCDLDTGKNNGASGK